MELRIFYHATLLPPQFIQAQSDILCTSTPSPLLATPLLNPPRLPRLNLIDPATDLHTLRHQLCAPQILDIILHCSVQLWKRQEIGYFALQLLHCFGAKVLLNDAHRVRVLERQHPTAGVFDEYDLGCAEELFADDDAA